MKKHEHFLFKLKFDYYTKNTMNFIQVLQINKVLIDCTYNYVKLIEKLIITKYWKIPTSKIIATLQPHRWFKDFSCIRV